MALLLRNLSMSILLFGSLSLLNFEVDGSPVEGLKLQESLSRNSESQAEDVSLTCDGVDSEERSLARSGIKTKEDLWLDDFGLVYFLPFIFSEKERSLINTTVEILREILPCVPIQQLLYKFPENYSQVVFEKDEYFCKGGIGRERKTQVHYLSPKKCLRDVKPLLHQFIHILGANHEHNRSDRDDFITIHWENIVRGKDERFAKVEDDKLWSTFGIPYNPKSIMHFAFDAHSKNGKPTISLKEGVTFAPDKPLSFGDTLETGLQQTDVDLLRKMYGCT